jgi:hypothetical protein
MGTRTIKKGFIGSFSLNGFGNTSYLISETLKPPIKPYS